MAAELGAAVVGSFVPVDRAAQKVARLQAAKPQRPRKARAMPNPAAWTKADLREMAKAEKKLANRDLAVRRAGHKALAAVAARRAVRVDFTRQAQDQVEISALKALRGGDVEVESISIPGFQRDEHGRRLIQGGRAVFEIAEVQRLRGFGAHAVLECVGSEAAMATAVGVAQPGGAIGRVGVPHYGSVAGGIRGFYQNITITGGPAPVRAYIDELLPDVLEGRIEPGRVFDRTVDLDGVPDGYRAMNDREALKVMVRP